MPSGHLWFLQPGPWATPPPSPWTPELAPWSLSPFSGPTPEPWYLSPFSVPWVAVTALVAAVGVQQLAATVPEGTLRSQLEQSGSVSIAQVLDDYCGTPPRLIPWPWPGPPPWVFSIAAELNSIANSVEAAGMQQGLLKVAGQVLPRGFGQGEAGAG
jgi:hypothetical protein